VQLAAPLQSPVAHESRDGAAAAPPGGGATQPVRAQRRPDQPAGAGNETVALGDSSNPPPPTAAALLPDNVAGQIVWLQLFRSVNTVVPAASAPRVACDQTTPANGMHAGIAMSTAHLFFPQYGLIQRVETICTKKCTSKE
jgi:hypothetical protein